MRKSWEPYARHIIDTIAKLRRIEARGSITEDEVLYDAALRNLQTLSEATQSLPVDLKERYSHIPWREISGFRNILVHNYLGDIDALTVAAVLDKYLDPLNDAIQSMLSQRDP